jgi:hypothetical protein
MSGVAWFIFYYDLVAFAADSLDVHKKQCTSGDAGPLLTYGEFLGMNAHADKHFVSPRALSFHAEHC